jgi:hypothetical protein
MVPKSSCRSRGDDVPQATELTVPNGIRDPRDIPR